MVQAGDEHKLGSLHGKVGGNLRPQIAIMLAPGCRVDPKAQTVTVRLGEDPDETKHVEHPEAENHVSVTFQLNDPHWEKWRSLYVPGGSTPPDPDFIGYGNPIYANTDLHYAYTYVATFAWHSTGPTGYDSIYGYYYDWYGWGWDYWDWNGWGWAGYGDWGWGPAWSIGDSKLLGHNGQHTVSMASVGYSALVRGQISSWTETGNQFPFQKFNPFGASWSDAPLELKPEQYDAQNVVITDVKTSNGTPDYFKFDPDADDHGLTNPSVSFTIKDEGDAHRYKWYLWAKPTRDEPNSVAITGIMDQPGTKTVTINQPEAGYVQDHPLTEWGTYAFDLRVVEIQNDSELSAGDAMDLRSEKISIPSRMVDAAGQPLKDEEGNPLLDEDELPLKGHSIDGWTDGDADFAWHASYLLKSERDASEVRVDLLDPHLNFKKTLPLPDLTHDSPVLDKPFYTPKNTDLAGTWKAVFAATDSFKDTYRDHRNRDMVAVNQTPKRFRARIYQPISASTDGSKPISNHTAWPATYAKKVGFSAETNYKTATGKQMLDAMTISRVVYIDAHGNATNDTEGGGHMASPMPCLQAKPLVAQPSGIAVYISDLVAKRELKNLRIVVFRACDSARTPTVPDYGNFLDQSIAAGAGSALGFDREIQFDGGNTWGHDLFQSLCVGTSNKTAYTDETLPAPPTGWWSDVTTPGPVDLSTAAKYASRRHTEAYGSEDGLGSFIVKSQTVSRGMTYMNKNHTKVWPAP